MDNLTVLSGADVGASCYLLEIGGARILLDCGMRIGGEYTEHPDITSPETIDAIFVSHAHLDHLGALAYTAAVCKNAKIYMTGLTKEFARYQLAATIADYIGADTNDLQFHNRILCELVMNRIEVVKYQEKCWFIAQNGQKCNFSFFHAGHVPGAAMVYLKVGDKTVLYTGDFASCDTSLTYPYSLPKEVKPDNLILCGTHSKAPEYCIIGETAIEKVERRLYDAVSKNNKFVIPTSQLTKGLEILAKLDDMIGKGPFEQTKVYLEPNLWALASYYAIASDTFRLPSYVHPLSEWEYNATPRHPIVVFERPDYDRNKFLNYTKINSDFTLHADFNALVALLRTLDPKNVFVVHAGIGEGSLSDKTLNPRLKSLVYTENGAVYEIA